MDVTPIIDSAICFKGLSCLVLPRAPQRSRARFDAHKERAPCEQKGGGYQKGRARGFILFIVTIIIITIIRIFREASSPGEGELGPQSQS